jgi:hypothetical protein
MAFEFVQELEDQVIGAKCVGLRRAVNHKAQTDTAKIRLFALGDVAKMHMDTCISYFVHNMHMTELDTCMFLETKGMVTLPTMIHYMDKPSQKKHCHKALRELLLARVWPGYTRIGPDAVSTHHFAPVDMSTSTAHGS